MHLLHLIYDILKEQISDIIGDYKLKIALIWYIMCYMLFYIQFVMKLISCLDSLVHKRDKCTGHTHMHTRTHARRSCARSGPNRSRTEVSHRCSHSTAEW